MERLDDLLVAITTRPTFSTLCEWWTERGMRDAHELARADYRAAWDAYEQRRCELWHAEAPRVEADARLREALRVALRGSEGAS